MAGKKQHALAIPLPFQGHINPLMRFCKKLASDHAFTITFLDINFKSKQQQQQQQEHHHVSHGIRRARIWVEGPDTSQCLANFSIAHFFESLRSGAAAPLEQILLELIHGDPPVTCLISDLYFTTPTQMVADKFKLPRIVLNTASQSALLFTHYLLEGTISASHALDVIMRKERLNEEIFQEGLSGLASIKNGDLRDYKEDSAYMYKFMVDELKVSKERGYGMVANSFEELEGSALKVDIGMPVYGVGPFLEPLETELNTNLWKQDDGCMPWLDEQPLHSVVYVSFGSVISLSQTQFEEIVAGLLSSKQRFLWVFRPHLIINAPYSSFPPNLLSKAHGRGYSVTWAPQLHVLSHPSVGGFLTHCGWNSCMEAISCGVPMLCYPFFSDQFLNAKYIVEEWKVGLRIKVCNKSFVANRHEVEKVMMDLMEGSQGDVLRANATSLKLASGNTLLQAGTSFQNLQALIQSLRETSSNFICNL